MNPVIHIQPDNDLIDAPIELRITQLLPNEIVMLAAHMYDNYGTYWASSAEFEADNDGTIDLATVRPRKGSYEDIDVNGLFWSMRPVPDNKIDVHTPLKSLETFLSVQRRGEVLAKTSIKRQLISHNVKRETVREQGLVGTFFYHSKKGPLPTIIVLGGSEGGLKEGSAALLASYGFNTLALAYFGIDDLPTELVHIPVDYIEQAIHWLSQQPNVDELSLGMMGTSKGGELALLCASMFSEIQAVVGYVPSSVVYQGIWQGEVKSSWTYKGKEIPFAQGHIPESVLNHVQTETNIVYRDWYLNVAEGEKEAEILVEKIQGPVLLISGADDQLWPADVLSERAINRLCENQHPFYYEHITFPYAGHAFGVPGLPTTRSTEVSFHHGRKLLLGGHPAENAQAQRAAWDKVKDFFTTHLK